MRCSPHNLTILSGGGSSSSVEARVLSTFLNEMDGIRGGGATGGQHDADSSNRHDEVLVVAATNRPKSLDAALLRPGRFEASVHVGKKERRTHL